MNALSRSPLATKLQILVIGDGFYAARFSTASGAGFVRLDLVRGHRIIVVGIVVFLTVSGIIVRNNLVAWALRCTRAAFFFRLAASFPVRFPSGSGAITSGMSPTLTLRAAFNVFVMLPG